MRGHQSLHHDHRRQSGPLVAANGHRGEPATHRDPWHRWSATGSSESDWVLRAMVSGNSQQWQSRDFRSSEISRLTGHAHVLADRAGDRRYYPVRLARQFAASIGPQFPADPRERHSQHSAQAPADCRSRPQPALLAIRQNFPAAAQEVPWHQSLRSPSLASVLLRGRRRHQTCDHHAIRPESDALHRSHANWSQSNPRSSE